MFLTYLAMHLYQGNCSDWRACFLRPGTEWNAAGAEERQSKCWQKKNSHILDVILQLLICQKAGATSSLTFGNSPLLNLQFTVSKLDLCTRSDSSELSLSCQVCLLQLPSSLQPCPTSSHSCEFRKRAKRSTRHSGCCCEWTWWEFWEWRRFILLLGMHSDLIHACGGGYDGQTK